MQSLPPPEFPCDSPMPAASVRKARVAPPQLIQVQASAELLDNEEFALAEPMVELAHSAATGSGGGVCCQMIHHPLCLSTAANMKTRRMGEEEGCET